MAEQQLICIICPRGCRVKAHTSKNNTLTVTGNACARGKAYAESEIQNPKRTLTGLIKITNAPIPVLSVRTSAPMPKKDICRAARALQDLAVQAPVSMGEVIMHDFCGLNVDLIATKSLPALCPKDTFFPKR